MNLQSIPAADFARAHIVKPGRVESDSKTYARIMWHPTKAVDGVHVFVTGSDNAVIVGSLKLTPQHEIEVTP